MRCVFKFLMLPVIFILSVMKLFLEGATKVYCLVAGVAINLLVIFSALAIITQQWFALVVFGVIFVFILGVLFVTGRIGLFLENLKDRIS